MTDFIHHSEQRPKFLNILKIKLPITAIASILHRLSGFVLFLLLPLVIYGLGLSLKNSDSFDFVSNFLDKPIFQWLWLIILVAIFYHLISGIRFLLIDVGVGLHLKSARFSALFTIIASIVFFGLLVFNLVVL